MHPTLRPAFAAMTRLRVRLGRRWRGGPASQRRQASLAVAPLEGRELLAFAPLSLSAVPTTLWPPNGREVAIAVSAKFEEFTIVNNRQIITSLSEPKEADFQVVDEYRRQEPQGPVHLVDEGNGQFSVAFTIHLQASRSTEFPAGRRYYLTVSAKDSDGAAGKTIAIQVPISLKDRGPGPVVGKPSPAYLRRHSHAHAAARTPTSTAPKPQGLGSLFHGL